MADNLCGCSSNNDPNNPTVAPNGTVYVSGSIDCPKGTAEPCYTPMCDDRFRTLPPARRLQLVGVNGRCMYVFDTSEPGLVMVDGKGGVVLTKSPSLDLPQLVNYAAGPNGLLLTTDRQPIEDNPPEFGYLMVQLNNGEWKKVRGKPNSIGLVVWDDDGFHIKDVDDANILISVPNDEAQDIKLIGFDTNQELEEGERNNLVSLTGTNSGILYFNTITGTVAVRGICDLFSDLGNLEGVPFLLACSDGTPIRFKGTDASVLVWNPTQGAFQLVKVDSAKCDPNCGCSTELHLIWDCASGTFSITEPETHVLLWRTNTDTGSNASIDFTLPWPAMVTIYALRRFVPTEAALDVHKADIIVDGAPATSPSDGGLVGRLDQSSTSMGVAVLNLNKGGHNAYIGAGFTTGEDITPTWSGTWMKIVAHKISDCTPTRPILGAGSIRRAYGGSGEECDCPPGPQGEQGIQGVPGPVGPPGPGGGGEDLGVLTEFNCIVDGVPTVITLKVY